MLSYLVKKVLVLSVSLVISKIILLNCEVWGAKDKDEDSLLQISSLNIQTGLKSLGGVQQSDSIPFLPGEILTQVFSYLTFKDIFSVALVCKQWKQAIEDNQLWLYFLKKAALIDPLEKYNSYENYKKLFQFYAVPSLHIFDHLNDTYQSGTKAISADGRTVVGYWQNSQKGQAAFIYTAEEELQFLNNFNDGTQACVLDVSANGKIAVGFITGYKGFSCQAFKWTKEKGMQFLNPLNFSQASSAVTISGDGKIIGGDIWNISGDKMHYAVIWIEGEGMMSLNTLSPRVESHVKKISGNGKTILGEIIIAPSKTRKVFKWTKEEGMQFLEELGETLYDDSLGISFDGGIISFFRGDFLVS